MSDNNGWSRVEGQQPDGKNFAFVTNAPNNFIELLSELFTESDRVAVIVSVAFIEELLREILRAFFIPPSENAKDVKEAKESLLGPERNGGLSTFGAMAHATFLLG